MKADLLLSGISQLVTAVGACPKKGRAMRELSVTVDAALAVADGRFVWCGRRQNWQGECCSSLDLGGRAVVPGLVDPHTHAVWAGDRLADFEARASGETYEGILKRGGGIRSTIAATARASVDELVRLARPRIAALIRSGATTIEIKSGYGFESSAELAMLQAVSKLAKLTSANLVPTLLIHIPPADVRDRQAYLANVCNELIPETARRGLANAVDVFVERESWSAEEGAIIFDSARRTGLGIKLHTEQFHRVGGLELGLRSHALSVDHLEAAIPQQFSALAASDTVATILPGVSLHLGIPAAPGRAMIDAGAPVAVGTDLNPGSSPLFSAAASLALAVRLNGLTPQEALVAGTVNAAAALGITTAGRIEAGLPADFLVLEGNDWRELVYTMGANPVRQVWIAGRPAAESGGGPE